MTTNILDEARRVTGGNFSITDEKSAQEIRFENGEFRLGIGGKTLVATGLKEHDAASFSLVSSWVKSALIEDKKKELQDALSSLFDPEVPIDDALAKAFSVGLTDCPRIVYFIVSDTLISDEPQLDILRETFADAAQDIFFLAHPYIYIIAKTIASIESPKAFALSVADTFLTEVMARVKVTYSAPCEYLSYLRKGQFQAAKAYRALQIGESDIDVLGFQDMGFAGIIADMDRATCEEFLYGLYGADGVPSLDEELKRAAARFLDHSLNISETARELYLHRNTFIYHLDKFEKVMGLNLRDFHDAMTYQMLCLVQRRLQELN